MKKYNRKIFLITMQFTFTLIALIFSLVFYISKGYGWFSMGDSISLGDTNSSVSREMHIIYTGNDELAFLDLEEAITYEIEIRDMKPSHIVMKMETIHNDLISDIVINGKTYSMADMFTISLAALHSSSVTLIGDGEESFRWSNRIKLEHITENIETSEGITQVISEISLFEFEIAERIDVFQLALIITFSPPEEVNIDMINYLQGRQLTFFRIVFYEKE